MLVCYLKRNLQMRCFIGSMMQLIAIWTLFGGPWANNYPPQAVIKYQWEYYLGALVARAGSYAPVGVDMCQTIIDKVIWVESHITD